MLEKVTLPEQYRTGHDIVDEQHAHLFAILMGIVTTIKNQKNVSLKMTTEKVQELVHELQSYTRNHFQYEERLMEKMKYPEIENHRKIHQGFIQKMHETQDHAFKKNETMFKLLNDMAAYVKEWYLQHVLGEDKKMIAYLRESVKASKRPNDNSDDTEMVAFVKEHETALKSKL